MLNGQNARKEGHDARKEWVVWFIRFFEFIGLVGFGLGRDEIEKQANYRDFLLNFDEGEEESFEQLERPMGYEEFLERLMKERGHYFPRRRGRSRKIICS